MIEQVVEHRSGLHERRDDDARHPQAKRFERHIGSSVRRDGAQRRRLDMIKNRSVLVVGNRGKKILPDSRTADRFPDHIQKALSAEQGGWRMIVGRLLIVAPVVVVIERLDEGDRRYITVFEILDKPRDRPKVTLALDIRLVQL